MDRDLNKLHDNLCSSRALIAFKSGRRYDLMPACSIDADGVQLANIVRICNEPLIYNNLFAGPLSNRPYALDDAQRFVSWSSDGWHNRTHFVYLIVDELSTVAGAIDIKSARLESAEIGYWLSTEHSGVMTSAVSELAALAQAADFSELHALVRTENARSMRVLQRAAFQYSNDVYREGRTYRRFARALGQSHSSPNSESPSARTN